MSKKKKRTIPKEIKLKPKGFDFGIHRTMMLVAAPDFNENLRLSNITGCTYGEIYSPELEAEIPIISLIAEKEEYIRKAFDQFHDWCAQQDGDSLDVNFIFLNEGGYLLCISPEIDRLKERISGYNRILDPIFFQLSWIKPIDTVDEYLKKISEYSKGLLAPIYFGATIHPPVQRHRDFHPENTIHVKGVLKFDTHFYNENELDTNNPAYYFVKKYYDKKKRASYKKGENPQQTPSYCFLKRKQIIRRNFFVTLNRYKRDKKLQAIKEKLENYGIQEWQIEQAICNLILSRQHFNSDLHYVRTRVNNKKDEIFEALNNHYERADSTNSLSFITEDNLLEQIKLDCIELLKSFGSNPKINEIEYLLRGLEKKGLLEEE